MYGHRKPLRINDKNGNMLVIIDPTMPDSMRGELVDRMFLVFEQDFKFVDTEKEGFSNMFPSMHYSLYNRYSVQVSQFFFHLTCLIYYRESREKMPTLIKSPLPIRNLAGSVG